MTNTPFYTVILTPQAEKEFRALDKTYLQATRKVLHRLEQYPLLGKPLTGELAGKFRLRFSRYRVVYELNHRSKLVVIQAIKHRKDIYR